MINFVLDSPLADAEIAATIGRELDRQANQIELIASENIVSADVLKAQGSVLTNKYAEGYPGRRYYGGCEHVDEGETLAIERGKALFGAGFRQRAAALRRTGQPSGVPGLLQPGDRIIGHVARPWRPPDPWLPCTCSGQAVRRGTVPARSAERFDGSCASGRCGPVTELISAGASAYPRAIDFAAFRRIADESGAAARRARQGQSPCARQACPCPPPQPCGHRDRIRFRDRRGPGHANGLVFTTLNTAGEPILSETYYSSAAASW